MSIYDIKVTTIRGEEKDLSEHKGKPMLIVNTASKCGFTPQFEGLEKLHQELGEQGLVVLGFPCNQFGKQDPGSDGEIESFCQVNYGVSFTMHSKVKVNGDDAHPLFQTLKKEAPGLLGTKAIKWNFTKFLVGPDGSIKRYGSRTKPSELKKEIEAMLK